MQNKHHKAFNPLIFEKSASGDEVYYDVFSRLLKERIIFVGEEITDELANSVVSQLLWLDKQSEEERIEMYINSEGGNLISMFAIYDIMQHVKAPVYTFALGTAASAAAVLLAAGKKGCRFSLPSSEIMIHQPLCFGIEGQVTDITINAKQMERNKKKMLNILARHTNKTYEMVERDCERDFFMDPPLAIKYGIIDEITGPSKDKEMPPVMHEKPFRKNWRR